MFTHLQDMLKALDVTDNSVRNRSPQCENYLRKLNSLSRYVTPCPAILDDVDCPNNNPTNSFNSNSVSKMEASPGKSSDKPIVRKSKTCQQPECVDSSDSSDESAWESVPTPTHMGVQWKNLIEYEASIQANQAHTSVNISPDPVKQNNLSYSPSASHQKPLRKESSLQNDDVAETLHSIARSLKMLQGHNCENATEMFGQYIAHRLSEMSDENRSAAEIEINKVLMKYIEKETRGDIGHETVQETLEEGNKNRYKGKKKKQNTK